MKLLIAAMLLCISYSCFSTTWIVAQQGEHAFRTIQEGIDASAHTDTVMVYPGIYSENVSFNGKNITLASLELITGNRDYIDNTIIDAQHNGPAILVYNYESNVLIRGFTIINGTGKYYPDYDLSTGGGILIVRRSGTLTSSIINCVVKDNEATQGGGISANGILNLTGVVIKNNRAERGGGINYYGDLGYQPTLRFSSTNRCSIFDNLAAQGCDISMSVDSNTPVILDTCSVAFLSNFYVEWRKSPPSAFNVLNSTHQEINSDLYVAPWGSDNNDGLSEATPLKTIFKAIYAVASDSLNPKTIYLAEGTYSPSLNNQIFPLPMKNHIRLKGSGKRKTILDAEMRHYNICMPYHTKNVEVSDLSLLFNLIAVLFNESEDVTFAHLYITPSSYAAGDTALPLMPDKAEQDLDPNLFSDSDRGLAGSYCSGRVAYLDVDIVDYHSPSTLSSMRIVARNDLLFEMRNCRIQNCSLQYQNEYEYSVIEVQSSYHTEDRLRVIVDNCLFTGNQTGRGAVLALDSLNDTLFVSNCTFADNLSIDLITRGNAVFRNSLFYSPVTHPFISMQRPRVELTSYGSFAEYNCFSALGGLYNGDLSHNQFYWGSGNFVADPLFVGSGEHPYRLSPLSQLIDAGSQALIAGAFTDLGGNERLWDGDGDGLAVIDIGAYEFLLTLAPSNLSAQLWQQQIILTWEMPAMDRSLSGYRIYRNNLPYAEINDPSLLQFRDYSPVNDTLSYYLVALYGSVESFASNSVTVIVEGVDNSDDVLSPAALNLTISPNPFSDIAVIKYNLSQASLVKMQIYNLKGQLVKTIINSSQSKGEQLTMWEGCDDTGRHLASGIYFLRLSIDGKLEKSRRLVLLK